MMDEVVKPHSGRSALLEACPTPTRQHAPDAQSRPGTVAPIIRASFDTTSNTSSQLCTRSLSADLVAYHSPQSSSAAPSHDKARRLNPTSTVSGATSFSTLPVELRQRIFDYISGELHSVTSTVPSHTLSSSMRHPRRKAVSDLALVGPDFRDLVQERIYRHIKIKGTRHGLVEVVAFFQQHPHLTKHVRHVEIWVPVWGDRTSIDPLAHPPDDGWGPPPLGGSAELGLPSVDRLGVTEHDSSLCFTRSIDSATVEEIFSTVWHFHEACIFTLEGGHCKKSNMIKPFRLLRFKEAHLPVLPHIRTFAMRGAWNIIRTYHDWLLLQNALPNMQEWHCGYAKPRLEAYDTVSQILLRFPTQLRHLNISLDGMYSKENTSLSSSSNHSPHICDRLGHIAPYLESLSYTGKVCSCFWDAANRAQKHMGSQRPRLQSLEIVVKSCCRQRVSTLDPETGEETLEEVGGIRADGAGITNLVFIRAFERWVLRAVESLDRFPLLDYIRIRFIDLDSPCAQLNPYWIVHKNKCSGVWSEDILEALESSWRAKAQGLSYLELHEGIDRQAQPRKGSHDHLASIAAGGLIAMYPRVRPKSIKMSTYRVVAEARST